MNLGKLFNSAVQRIVTEGKKKTAEAAGIAVLLLSNWLPVDVARDIITGAGALWAAYKLYDKD
tara:strand:+ start:137 stop:325 length:189 start_codon:yes stop_codon:yes gene_type:complete